MSDGAARRELAGAPRHSIAVDWDGTLVPARWPEQPTEFLPGAVEALFKLHRAGFRLFIYSARLSPYDPWNSRPRPAEEVEAEHQYVRSALDSKGLTFVDVWRLPGKPSASVYIDDKAERYTGRPGSWRAVTNKVLLRLGSEEPLFPAFDQAVAEETRRQKE